MRRVNGFRHKLSQYMNSQDQAEYSTVSPVSHIGNLCLQLPIAPLRKINMHTLRWQGIVLWWMENSYNFKRGALHSKGDHSLRTAGAWRRGLLCLLDNELHEDRAVPDSVCISHIAEHRPWKPLLKKRKPHSVCLTTSRLGMLTRLILRATQRKGDFHGDDYNHDSDDDNDWRWWWWSPFYRWENRSRDS